jgi:ATP-dependent DNA helicase RecQ
MRGRSQHWVMDMLRALLAAGWIDLTPTEHPVPLLTPAGADAMRGSGPLRFVLPRERDARGRDRPRRPRSDDVAPAVSAAMSKLDDAARERFERLRAHRASVAKSRGVPAYIVAPDRTLVEMALARPRTHAELLAVFGMGPARIDLYGDGFLEALHSG